MPITKTLSSHAAAALLVIAGSIASAADLHVPGQFPTITIALANASNGDVIRVAPGTYPETLDLGNKRVSIISTQGPEVTTIDAFGLGSVLRITGGQGTDTVIEGLTIKGGLAYRGAGIFIDGSSATVRNCVFVENMATLTAPGGTDPGDGGGIFIENGELIVESCEFDGNEAVELGGGLYARTNTTVTVTDSSFTNNLAASGSGLALNRAQMTITRSAFVNNGNTEDAQFGGGLYTIGGTVAVEASLFDGNAIFDDGSAVFSRGESKVNIQNSVFTNNLADVGSTPNAVIYANESGTVIDVFHCTIVGNTSAATASLRGFGDGVIRFRNGIIWGNSGTVEISGSVTATYSLIQGGFSGLGNIGEDSSQQPLFADANNGNFRLLQGSPGIDAADTNILLGQNPVDYDGNPRAVDDPQTPNTGIPVYGLTADMGAFEFQVDPVASCPGDIADSNGTLGNVDGQVDFGDLLALLGLAGPCP
jgi:hypothetical protein